MTRETGDAVAGRVRAFYEECSFPGYEEFDTPQELAEKAGRGIYARLLDEQLPLGVCILDAGCGTGQLSLFLSMLNRRVVGIDFSRASLRKGYEFKTKFDLGNAHFLQMDLFRPGLKAESFDYVFCNGVLHHTADARAGFRVLCDLLRPGGFIVIGLYNRCARLPLDLRRMVFRATGGRLLWLDFFMRHRGLGKEKKRTWYQDQYENPHEEKFSVGTVLGWFREAGIEYVNSVPKINLGERLTADERLFEPHYPGSGFDHLVSQAGWIFTTSREGGFFVTIGRKPGGRR